MKTGDSRDFIYGGRAERFRLKLKAIVPHKKPLEGKASASSD